MMEQKPTKARLALALKGLLNRSSMDKITVGDIAEACGIGRQSFYYHFKDKYALLEWMIRQDLETCLNPCPDLEQWQIYTLNLLEHIRRQERFYTRVVSGESQLFFHQYSTLLESQLLRVLVGEDQVSPAVARRLRFAARFFSYGFAGALVQWISEGMKIPPQECILHLHQIGMDAGYLQSLKTACHENLTLPSHNPLGEQV